MAKQLTIRTWEEEEGKKTLSERIQWGLLPNEQCTTSSYFLTEALLKCDQTVIVLFLTWQATNQQRHGCWAGNLCQSVVHLLGQLGTQCQDWSSIHHKYFKTVRISVITLKQHRAVYVLCATYDVLWRSLESSSWAFRPTTSSPTPAFTPVASLVYCSTFF